MSEALYIADRKAREAVEMRAQIEKKLAQKEKEKKEQNLRDLAQKAREERAGIHRPAAAATAPGAAAAAAAAVKDGEPKEIPCPHLHITVLSYLAGLGPSHIYRLYSRNIFEG